MELKNLDLTQIHRKLVEHEVSSVELTKACLARIKKIDSKIRAFILVDEEKALEQAKNADQELADKENISYLTGVPFGVKDVILTEGLETTASSNILKGYVGAYNATCVEKILKQKGVLIGKTNADAFAHGASTENSDFFPSSNPYDLERVPGGSSGGSAAAVAAGEACYALGTDTGGSIRQPAAFCNLVGLKPTYGRASRYGLIAMTSSTDCPGILTRDVNDAAVVLSEIAGEDYHDMTTLKAPVPDFPGALRVGPNEKFTIGLPKEFFAAEGLEDGVKKVIAAAIKRFETLGAGIVEISLPHACYGVAVYYVLTPSELSSNLERFDGIRYGYSAVKDQKQTVKDLFEVYSKTRGQGFGNEAKRRIMIGTHTLSAGYIDAYFKKASKVRTLIINEFKEAFEKVDVILSPTSPTTPFKIGEKTADPLAMYLEDIFLTAVSLAGLPALSMPAGFATPPEDPLKKLPVGLQLITAHYQESKLLQIAKVYEQVTAWRNEKPIL